MFSVVFINQVKDGVLGLLSVFYKSLRRCRSVIDVMISARDIVLVMMTACNRSAMLRNM